MSGEEGFAAGWRPKKGDRLEGVITELDIRYGEYEPYPIVVLDTGEGGAVAFHGFHTMAKKELAKRRPQIGDRIAITFHGKKRMRNGQEFAAYVIETPDRPPPPFKWGAFAGGEDAYEEEPLDEPDPGQPQPDTEGLTGEDSEDEDLPF
jgi:hypothetical protein